MGIVSSSEELLGLTALLVVGRSPVSDDNLGLLRSCVEYILHAQACGRGSVYRALMWHCLIDKVRHACCGGRVSGMRSRIAGSYLCFCSLGRCGCRTDEPAQGLGAALGGPASVEVTRTRLPTA